MKTLINRISRIYRALLTFVIMFSPEIVIILLLLLILLI